MKERKILWKIFPSYLAVTVLALGAAVWFAAHTTEELFETNVEADLGRRGRLIEPDVLGLVATGDFSRLEAWCEERGARAAMRITVILPDGQVAADSDEDPAAMGNHKGRIEVAEALAGGQGRAVHYSETLHRDMLYVALPLRGTGGEMEGVLRMSVPLLYAREALRPFLIHIVWGGIVIAAFAGAIALVIARRLSAPLEELRTGAERLARGDFSSNLSRSGITEVERVVEAMNGMAAELDRRIHTIVDQRNELEGILSSMVEGVLAVDIGERISSVNAAAARMLGLEGRDVLRRKIREVVDNESLHEVVAKALSAEDPIEMGLVLGGESERFLQVHGVALRDSQGVRAGALVVLNDLTRIKRLENLRREFVANVSHELRTPITSIKGFVETLQGGSFSSPEEAARFLGIIARQVDHLIEVIEDLLLLSRLDEAADRTSIPKAENRVREVIESAVQVCANKAREKRVDVEIDCDGEMKGNYNAPLLEQALVNLVDNAVKYSECGTKVIIGARVRDGDLVIAVTDQGCGIGKEDIPRIFERFYRVDKARSRKLGGTGLGLSIVKHIARVHGGRVFAESELGKGSTFTMYLPIEGLERAIVSNILFGIGYDQSS
jgi:two-component system, OmpR family, phosphate regulon sensor histidine kinase PhoR